MSVKNKSIKGLLSLGVMALLSACSTLPLTILGGQFESYFDVPSAKGKSFTQVSPGIYAFQHSIDTSLVVRTQAGLLVVDPFNQQMATALSTELKKRFPGVPVTHLFYSHHHLDHIGGGAVLKPTRVLAPENMRKYVQHYKGEGVLTPTQYLKGDNTLNIGGRKLKLVNFPGAHGESLYGFYFPQEKILYAPDLAFCRVMPPFGYPDYNHYGHVAALKKALRLDFKILLNSHFAPADKNCLQENLALYQDTRAAYKRALRKHRAQHPNAAWFKKVTISVYGELKQKYGHWHGFKEMGMPFILRQLSGSLLGF